MILKEFTQNFALSKDAKMDFSPSQIDEKHVGISHYSHFKVGWNHPKSILCIVKYIKTEGWTALEYHSMNYQFFQAKSVLFDSVYEFWKYTQTLSQDFSPRKAYFWKILQGTFLFLMIIWTFSRIFRHVFHRFGMDWNPFSGP